MSFKAFVPVGTVSPVVVHPFVPLPFEQSVAPSQYQTVPGLPPAVDVPTTQMSVASAV
jgi:hypothetical protein